MITCQSLIYLCEQNNAGKNIWLGAQTANRKLKQNVQTQDANGMQAILCVIYDTVRGYISTITVLIEWGWGSELPAPYIYVSTEGPGTRHAVL